MSLATGSQTAPSFSSPTHLQPLFPVTTGTTPSLANPLPSPHPIGPSTHAGIVLSPAAEPFPRKLVEKVRSGQFIEMRELLADNITPIHQLESIQGCNPLHTLGPTRPRLREVSSLPTWCYCFLGYMAILTSNPSTRDQLAYARLVIKETLRHGRQGWLDYDTAFRQQAAAELSLRWNTLLPGLQASTILGQRNRQEAAFCTLCREGDHTRAQCALVYLQPPTTRNPSTTYPTAGRRRQENICTSWNRGTCILPGNCAYRHICATCHLPHKAKDCPRTPDTSYFKQARPTLPTASSTQHSHITCDKKPHFYSYCREFSAIVIRSAAIKSL